MAEEEQDFSKLGLEERCQHKNWKARMSGYEELTKIFERIDEDKEWNKYGPWVKKFPVDSNAAAQEKGMEVTLLYLENAPLQQSGRVVGEVMSGIVNKGLTATRAKTKELVMALSLMCVEVEKYETVQEELMKGMEHKNPKVVGSCVSILTEILKAFGPKVINLKTLVKKIPPLTEDRDKTVRDETKKLMVELYKWLGPGFKQQMSTSAVKAMVLQDVEAEVEKCTDKPQVSRYLRSHQAQKERGGGALEEEGGTEDVGAGPEVDVAPDIDLFDLLEPVDILSKLPKDFYEKCEAKKWQDRKEAMEALETLAGNPRLEAGDYGDLVRALKKIIAKDTNVVVVALAGKCLTGIANGLKKKFSPYASSCVSTILEKFKEKKSNVVTAMREAIDACYAATSLEAVQEDVIGALQNKNPSVKVETNAFLARVFAKTPYRVISDKKLMKPVFTAILACLNESDPAVREAAAEAFGVAMKNVGEKALASLTIDMEPIKLQKVKEFMDKAVITAPKEKATKSAPKTESAKPSASGPKAVVRKPVARKPPGPAHSTASMDDAPIDKPSKASVVAPKPATKVPSTTTASRAAVNSAAKKGATTGKTAADDPVGSNLPVNNLKAQRISDEMKLRILKWSFTTPREEFIELLKELMCAAGIGQNLMSNMFNQNFKMHLKAIDTLQDEFNQSSEGTKANMDLIMKWATLRFFDTNPSVLIRILDYFIKVFQLLTDEGYNMSEIEASAFVPYLVIKLGESKENVRTSVHEILRLIGNFFPPPKLFTFILEGLKSKNARQRTDCIDELGYMIGQHGMNVMTPTPQAALKDIAKQISDRDTNVRNAALNCVVQAYYLVGDKVFKMIGQLADKDQSLMEERIKRAGKQRPPPSVPGPAQPSRASTTARVQPISSVPNDSPTDQHRGMLSPPPTATVPPLRTQQSPPGGVLQPQNLNSVSPTEEFSNRMINNHGSIKDLGKTKNGVPEKYRVDFEAIDNMFIDNSDMPPMELLDTNIDQFMQAERIVLPKRRDGQANFLARRNFEAPANPGPQMSHSIDMMVCQLGEEDLKQVITTCSSLERMLMDSETAAIMSGRVDAILDRVVVQFRRQQMALASEQLDSVQMATLNKLFKALIVMLTVLFKNEFLPKRASTDAIKNTIQTLLVLIVDDSLEQLVDAVTIIRLINIMVVRIIENGDPNAVSCALIRLLNETLCETPVNSRLLELVMKCQWKLLKQHSNVWTYNQDYRWDIKAVLQEYHAFLKKHPFSSFATADATPLKTVKTIVHALITQEGPDKVQSHLNEMPDLKHSEGGIHITKLISREIERKLSAIDSLHS